MSSPSPGTDPTLIAALTQLSEVKGQLSLITQMIQNGQDSTNQRISDLSNTVDTRFNGLETRLGTLEKNERDTALRTAVAGAISGLFSGAMGSAGMALLKR